MDLLAAMRTFVQIVDRGSMTAAAEALGRSQPAVVRTLAALEKNLGATLLQRTTRRMSLTPEGRDYLERCRRILADVEDAELAVGPQDGEPRGMLRITAPVEFGRRHVAPPLLAFLDRHPKVRIDLMLQDRNVDLIEEGVDLGVRIGRLEDSSMISVRAGTMRRVVGASPSLLTRTGRPSHPAELAGLPCVRMQNLLRRDATWQFRIAGETKEIQVDGAFGCNQIAVSAEACAAGIGFARFLHYQVEDLIASGKIVPVLEDYEPEPSPVSLVYPGGRLVSTRLRAILDWLGGSLRTYLGGSPESFG